MTKEQLKVLRARLKASYARLREYLSAIEQENYEFTSEFENCSIEELEYLAETFITWYGGDDEHRNSFFSNPDKRYGKLLHFILQIRIQKLNEQFVFNQKNIKKIVSLDKQLQVFFEKLKKETDKEINRLEKRMKKNKNIDSVAIDIVLINIIFSNDSKRLLEYPYYLDIDKEDYGLSFYSPFFTGCHTPYWKKTYIRTTAEMEERHPELEACWERICVKKTYHETREIRKCLEKSDKIPFFDFSSQHEISNHFRVSFKPEENSKEFVKHGLYRIETEPAQCAVGNAFHYIYEMGCFSLSEMLCIEEIRCEINNVRYKTKIKI